MHAARLETPRVTSLPLPHARTTRRQGNDGPVYYAGPENALVAGAVSRLIGAADGSRVCVSPLTLIGPPGCGKSLLAEGVTAAWSASRGEEAVLSLTGLDFRRRLEQAYSAERRLPGAVRDLTQRFTDLKLLVLEDLDGLSDSPSAVEQFTSAIDQMASAKGAVLVTASRPLGEITGLDCRLVGRLAAGLTIEVAAPAEAARQELLVASLNVAGCPIETAAAADLAAWLPADARRVLAVAEQVQRRYAGRRLITRSDVRAFVAEAAGSESSTPLSDIAAVVARYYAMPLRTLRSSSRKAPVVLARAVTIYLARQLTPLSYDDIGRYLGGRDHTTVMHNYNRISSRMPSDRALRSAMDDLFRKLGRVERCSRPVDPKEADA